RTPDAQRKCLENLTIPDAISNASGITTHITEELLMASRKWTYILDAMQGASRFTCQDWYPVSLCNARDLSLIPFPTIFSFFPFPTIFPFPPKLITPAPVIEPQSLPHRSPSMLTRPVASSTKSDFCYSRNANSSRARTIRCSGALDDNMTNIIVAQLLYLDVVDPNEDITMYVNSRVGSVTAGHGVANGRSKQSRSEKKSRRKAMLKFGMKPIPV
uniref:Uncharacterized protein n=1 Tax=Cucumis melo TaxID=3656 RepID=A0A9I9ED76_CUCME